MRKKLLSIILSLAVLIQFAGCSNSNEKEEITTEITTELEIDEFTEEDLLVLLNEIASVEVNYNYEEYYDFDYEDVLRVANTYQECDNDLGDFDYSDLIIKILDNSEIELNYDKSINELYFGKNDKENKVTKAFRHAVYSLEKDLSQEDYCKLQNFKIKVDKIDEEGVLARYENEKNLIIVDYDEIVEIYNFEHRLYKEYKLMEQEEDNFVLFEDYLTEVIRHELNHARQFICDCRKNKGQENTNAFYSKEDYVDFLIEASAESEIYNTFVNIYKFKDYNEKNIITYTDERKTQSYILLLGLLKKDFSLEKYYEAIFNSDLKSFIDLFDLKTEEEIENFYKICYALNSKNFRTKLSTDLRNDPEVETYGDLYDAIGNDYKIDIFKITVSDLIQKSYKENMDLSECLTLYNYIKSLIVYLEADSKGQEDGKEVWYFEESFLNSVGTIDSLFYEFITNYYNKELKEIKNDEKEIRSFVSDLFYYSVYGASSQKREFLEKYPLLSEISFSNRIISSFITQFDEAYENGYTRERYLKLGE